MTRTFVRTMSFMIILAMALTVGTALAQETRITGTVSRTDPMTRTIYFADGSAVRVQPGAVVMMNGRNVPFESLTPGANTTVRPEIGSRRMSGVSSATRRCASLPR